MDDGQVQRTVGKKQSNSNGAVWFLSQPAGRTKNVKVKKENSRVSVAVLDATEVSLGCQQDPDVPGAAVLQQGSGGLSGTLRGSAVEGGGWKHGAESHHL